MKERDPDRTLYLIDTSSFIFRAFYAIRTLTNSRGEPTNAVFGVAQMMTRLIQDADPKHLIAVYDSKEPSFRKEVYSEYKANRSAPPDDLIPQFARIEELIKKMGIHSERVSGVEADDIIATLARQWSERSPQNQVVIVTGDKDLMQLVDDRTVVWDTMKEITYTPKEVEEKFGVPPSLIGDYLAIVGDSSDNIPGIRGIGPKGALTLIKEFGALEQILVQAQAGKIEGKRGEAIREHAADARLSRELVTLKEDVSLQGDPTHYTFKFEVSDELIALLHDLDFHSLAEKWKPGARVEQKIPETTDEFRTIRTEQEFQTILQLIHQHKEFTIDLETTSLNPREAQIVGIALCVDDAWGAYVPVAHRDPGTQGQLSRDWVLQQLKPALEDVRYKKIGQNLKYDFSVLKENGIHARGIGADTMIASYVLDPSNRHGFDALCLKYLNYRTMTFEDVCGKGKDQIGFDEVPIERATRYSAEDALYTQRLWRVMQPLLESGGLLEVFARVELPLVPVLVDMECAGVRIDVGFLNVLSERFAREIAEIEKRVAVYSKTEVNLNSPKQIGKLLFEELGLPTQGKTKTGYSTDVTALEALAPLHEVPRLLLEYREIAKLKGTYVDPLPLQVDAKTGRVHASFHQTVAATGRLSSSDPNLQNIPIRTERGALIRKAFIPSEGCSFVSADYSQIELRILAHISGDAHLIESFKKGEDVHRRTASEIFHVTPESVTDAQRGIAKAINFGLMYGKTPFGLAQELGIPQSEARDMIRRYFERYHAVKELLDRQIAQAHELGYTTTLLGRKRLLPDLKNRNGAIRAIAERMAMNTPIQGTAADMIKLAMIELHDGLAETHSRARLLIQVHDELVLECPDQDVESTQRLIVECMEGAMTLQVPLVVNVSVGKTWGDL